MPKNKGKGGKNRRRGKNENEETKRQLEFKEPGQEYSQVVRMLGNGRCECYCFDGVTRLGHIRGKMRTAPRGNRSGGLGPFFLRRRRGG
jgi:translation initiation factor 1A